MTLAILTALIVLAIAAWVVNPLLKNNSTNVDFILDQYPDKLRDLQFERSIAMRTLKEIDFDFQTGKTSKTVYEHLRNDAQRRTIDILKSIEDTQEKLEQLQKKLRKMRP